MTEIKFLQFPTVIQAIKFGNTIFLEIEFLEIDKINKAFHLINIIFIEIQLHHIVKIFKWIINKSINLIFL